MDGVGSWHPSVLLRRLVMAAVWGLGAGLSISSADSSWVCWLPSRSFCYCTRMRAMVSCSHLDIHWVVLAAVAKSSWISGSRRLSMPSCLAVLDAGGHSWLWLLIKNLRMEVHGPASDWPLSASNILWPRQKAAWGGGTRWHHVSGCCVPGAYSPPGLCRVLGLQPPMHPGWPSSRDCWRSCTPGCPRRVLREAWAWLQQQQCCELCKQHSSHEQKPLLQSVRRRVNPGKGIIRETLAWCRLSLGPAYIGPIASVMFCTVSWLACSKASDWLSSPANRSMGVSRMRVARAVASLWQVVMPRSHIPGMRR